MQDIPFSHHLQNEKPLATSVRTSLVRREHVEIKALVVACKLQAMSSSDPEEDHNYAYLEAGAPSLPVRSDSLAMSL